MKHIHGGNVYEQDGINNKKVIDFSANINPLGMHKVVKEAAINAIEDSIHYPEPESKHLKRMIADYYGINDKDVIIGNGAAEVIFSLVNVLKPKKALLIAPTFYEYEQALLSVDCSILRYYPNHEYFDINEYFVSMITDDTDIVFVCNPNNPTGRLVNRDLLSEIKEKCRQSKALLVIDESFLDFTKEYGKHTMCNELVENSNIFVLKSFTKIFAMPGLRLGCGLCTDSKLLEKLSGQLQPWNVSLPAQYAGIAAMSLLKQKVEYIEDTVKLVGQERLYLIEEISKLGYKVIEGTANFILFKADEKLGDFCKENNVLLRDCSNFEGLSQGWYRTAVKTHEENVKLIDVISKYTQK